MSKDAPRFDVRYGSDDVNLDYHFCREWDGDRGCYGTNPDHGFTFEEAKEHIVAFFESRIAYWRGKTLEQWEAATVAIPEPTE